MEENKVRLNPPKIEIPAGNPYINDVFGNRKQFGDSLINLIKRVEDNLVICLDAQWGDGKTTFLKMWEQGLEDKGYHYIHYDAFKHDYTEDPFFTICAEIYNLPILDTKNENFKRKAINVGKKILTTSLKIAVKAGTIGILDGKVIDEIGQDVSQSVSDIAGSTLEEYFEDYNKEQKAINDFRSNLESITDMIRNDSSIDFPLVVIVDELDRCRPDFALKVLERIKHYFDISNLVFVIATNTKQLETIIKSNYGNDIDASNYLQKFFTLKLVFPKNHKRTIYDADDYTNYAQYMRDYHQLNYPINEYPFKLVAGYSRYYGFSLRNMENIFKKLQLYNLMHVHGFTDPVIVVMLSIIEFVDYKLLEELSKNIVSYNEIVSKLDLDKGRISLIDEHTLKGLDDRLKLYLLNDSELNDPDFISEKMNLFEVYMNRLEVIPFICKEYMTINKLV